MRTTVKIETSTKILEVELKLVDGKQIVEVELAELLEMLGDKAVKAPAAARAAKVAKAAKIVAADKPVADKPAGAKRGRKPKVIATISEGMTESKE